MAGLVESHGNVALPQTNAQRKAGQPATDNCDWLIYAHLIQLPLAGAMPLKHILTTELANSGCANNTANVQKVIRGEGLTHPAAVYAAFQFEFNALHQLLNPVFVRNTDYYF
jgi:hypothetical protein